MLIDPRSVICGVASKRDIHQLQELVHSRDEGLRTCAEGFFSWNTIEHNDLICHVGSHNEIVLDYESGAFTLHNPPLHNSGGDDTLLRIQVS